MDKADIKKAEEAAKMLRQSINSIKQLANSQGGEKEQSIASELDALSKIDPLSPDAEQQVHAFINKLTR